MNKANIKENAYSTDQTSSIFFVHQMIIGSSMPFVKNMAENTKNYSVPLCYSVIISDDRIHEVC